MRIEIINQTKKRIPSAFLKKWVKSISKEIKKIKKENLTIVFVTKVQSKKLNKSYRNKNYATDVLSFGSFKKNQMPELVLCTDVIQKQAREHSLSFNNELGYMVLHGILHLLGYEHEKSKSKAKKMFQLQDAIFEKLTS